MLKGNLGESDIPSHEILYDANQLRSLAQLQESLVKNNLVNRRTQLSDRCSDLKVVCCVFRPAVRCYAHPRVGRNTFFGVFDLFC